MHIDFLTHHYECPLGYFATTPKWGWIARDRRQH